MLSKYFIFWYFLFITFISSSITDICSFEVKYILYCSGLIIISTFCEPIFNSAMGSSIKMFSIISVILFIFVKYELCFFIKGNTTIFELEIIIDIFIINIIKKNKRKLICIVFNEVNNIFFYININYLNFNAK